MIDTELDEGQRQLQASARRLFADVGGLEPARRRLEHGEGFDRGLWASMTALGLPGIAVPEAHGGGGGGLVDLSAVSLETGRALVASPLVPSSVVAAHVLAAAAEHPSSAELLAGIAAGDTIVIPAVVEAGGLWDEDGIECRIEGDGGGFRLSGTKVLVPFADAATRLLVAARGPEGVGLVLVDPAAAGVSISPVDNLAALPLGTVAFAGVAVAASDVVAAPGRGWALLGPALARGAVLRSAEIAGAGELLCEMAVDYAGERVQFGKPIGVHQAVQYLCTDIAIEAHVTSMLARRAAWLLDVGRPAERAVAAAKLYASRAAVHMAHQAHEVFAGLAFMMEHDLHLITRHAKHWEHDLGDVRHHRELLVQALEGEV